MAKLEVILNLSENIVKVLKDNFAQRMLAKSKVTGVLRQLTNEGLNSQSIEKEGIIKTITISTNNGKFLDETTLRKYVLGYLTLQEFKEDDWSYK